MSTNTPFTVRGLIQALSALDEQYQDLPVRLDSAQIVEGAHFESLAVDDVGGDAVWLYASLPKTYTKLAEIPQLKQWVNDLQSKLFINCVYCGHRYGPGESGTVPAKALAEHIKACPKHPLAAALAENRELRETLRLAWASEDEQEAAEGIPREQLVEGHLYLLGKSRVGSVGLWDGKEFLCHHVGTFPGDDHLEGQDHWDDNDTTGTATAIRDLGSLNDIAQRPE